MTNKFYKDDVVLLEISTGCYTEVMVLEVKFAYGNVRYVVAPTRGKGQMTVEKLTKKK